MARLLAARGVALAVMAVGYLTACTKPADEAAVPDGVSTATAGTGVAAVLYFPASSGQLEPETRETPAELDAAARKRWLAEQLAAGPTSEGLTSPFPPGTSVAGVFAAPDGTIYADFTLSEDLPGMGSAEELLALYSVVNTLLLDDETGRRVVLLFNGRQRESLAGHVDTTRPLAARPDLIREAG